MPTRRTRHSSALSSIPALVDLDSNPSADSWRFLFRYADSGAIIPALLICFSFLLFGRYFLDSNLAPAKVERRNVLGTLLLLYWVPILLVASFATESNERYLLHLHPIGLILVGFPCRSGRCESARPVRTFAPSRARVVIAASIDVIAVVSASVLPVSGSPLVTATGLALVLRAPCDSGIQHLSRWRTKFSPVCTRSMIMPRRWPERFTSHPPLFSAHEGPTGPDGDAGRTVTSSSELVFLSSGCGPTILAPIAAIVATGALRSPLPPTTRRKRECPLVVLSEHDVPALVAFVQTLKIAGGAYVLRGRLSMATTFAVCPSPQAAVPFSSSCGGVAWSDQLAAVWHPRLCSMAPAGWPR